MVSNLFFHFTIEPQTETSVVACFDGGISEITLYDIIRLKEAIQANPFYGFRETVSGYTSLTVYYDPLKVLINEDLPGDYAFEKVSWYLRNIQTESLTEPAGLHKIVQLPVCYAPDLGPDLAEVSLITGLNQEEIIQLHAEQLYTVFMIGFIPGFPYLGGMNKKLAAPRRSDPRAFVPAGAVGIAGEQTGVYPLDSPGGWQIIGRTPIKLFDPYAPQPALLKAGDHVRFLPITLNEYNELTRDESHDN